MVSGFQGFRVAGFHRGRDRYRDRDRLFHHGTLSWVSRFHGFRVSWFQGFIGVGIAIGIGIDCFTTGPFLGFHGFRVSSKSGSGSLSGSGSIVSPQNTFLGFMVSGFRGFRVSRFQGFIGVGIAIGIGIDCFTTEHFLGFQGFMVSGFHPNRGRDRYRDRDRSFNHRTQPPHSLTASQSHSL